MYVYIRSEPELWTVGFYKPNGDWEAESDHNDSESAAERVHYLNGGNEEEETNPYLLDSEEIQKVQQSL